MRYYYNGEWYSYEYLNTHYGITKVPASPVTLYNTNLNEFYGWEDDSNKTWVTADTQWYTQQSLPYYKQTPNYLSAYLIDQQIQLQCYTLRDQNSYEYNDRLYSYSYLYNNFGITLTPSEVYYAKDGIIKCWFNRDNNLYWDTDTSRWYNYPPSYDEGGSIVEFDDINDVGAMGLFLFHSQDGRPVQYGSLVSGNKLSPICLRFPTSGEFTCSKVHTASLTGTWRLLTATAISSIYEPCIVFAMKVSDESLPDSSNNINNSIVNNNGNVTNIVEYDF